MESQRPDGYEELPPVSVTTGLCYFFQVSVVQDPDSHAVMLIWCSDIAALTYWAGPTSLPVSDPSMAISRLWNSGKQAAWHAVEPTLTTDTLFLLPSAISVSGIQSWTEKLANVD